jgi:hypothetical protein
MLSSIADTGCFVTDGNHTLPVPQQVGANWHGAIFLKPFFAHIDNYKYSNVMVPLILNLDNSQYFLPPPPKKKKWPFFAEG